MTSLLSLSQLQELAPSHLPSRRRERYRGDDQRVDLAYFAADDQKLLKRIYDSLATLLKNLRVHHERHTDPREELKAFVEMEEMQILMESASHLGHATSVQRSCDEFNRVIHDLRGGAFQALSFQLQLFTYSPDTATGTRNMYCLVRDHLKIMRHAVHDLDPEGFRQDSLMRPHDTQLMIEKWAHTDFHAVKRPVHISLTCPYSGTLCKSCLEIATLDRIIYNLMNNAARFTADETVEFYIFGMPATDPETVRFVVANPVDDEHRRLLEDQFGDKPGELFRGGFSTGGHGVGARISADFCANAFGISNFDQALDGGYFGAKWIDTFLAVWFHWPVVED